MPPTTVETRTDEVGAGAGSRDTDWRDGLAWQAGLLDLLDGAGSGGTGSGRAGSDRAVRRRAMVGAERTVLGHGAWVDVVERWWPWPDDLFARLVDEADYRLREMVMYDRVVEQPRLTAGWDVVDLPTSLADVADAADELSKRYDVRLSRVTTNLYRDGQDSVAWHGDRVLRDVDRSVVAVLTLGATRAFRLRPREGVALPDGARAPTPRTLRPCAGDLVVMGGTCQRTWQHAVPKVADAGPRISVMFRHAVDPEGRPVPARTNTGAT